MRCWCVLSLIKKKLFSILVFYVSLKKHLKNTITDIRCFTLLFSFTVCNQFSLGVYSMLGAVSPDSFDTLHSYSNTFQMPFVTPWFPEKVSSWYFLYVFSYLFYSLFFFSVNFIFLHFLLETLMWCKIPTLMALHFTFFLIQYIGILPFSIFKTSSVYVLINSMRSSIQHT